MIFLSYQLDHLYLSTKEYDVTASGPQPVAVTRRRERLALATAKSSWVALRQRETGEEVMLIIKLFITSCLSPNIGSQAIYITADYKEESQLDLYPDSNS